MSFTMMIQMQMAGRRHSDLRVEVDFSFEDHDHSQPGIGAINYKKCANTY